MTIYTPAKKAFLSGDIDLLAATIKVQLIKDYTYVASHEFVSDLTGTLSSTATLTGKLVSSTGTEAFFAADDLTFATTPADPGSSYYLVMYQSSAPTGGADLPTSSQRLIAYFTLAYGPLSPIGGPVELAWDLYAIRLL